MGTRVIQDLKATKVFKGQQVLEVPRERGAPLASQVSQASKASLAPKALRAQMEKPVLRENRAARG